MDVTCLVFQSAHRSAGALLCILCSTLPHTPPPPTAAASPVPALCKRQRPHSSKTNPDCSSGSSQPCTKSSGPLRSKLCEVYSPAIIYKYIPPQTFTRVFLDYVECRVAAYVVTKLVASVFIKSPCMVLIGCLNHMTCKSVHFTSTGFAGVRCVGNVKQGAHGEGMFCRRSFAWGERGNLCFFSELSQCFSETPTLPATVGRRERQQRYRFFHRRALWLQQNKIMDDSYE